MVVFFEFFPLFAPLCVCLGKNGVGLDVQRIHGVDGNSRIFTARGTIRFFCGGKNRDSPLVRHARKWLVRCVGAGETTRLPKSLAMPCDRRGVLTDGRVRQRQTGMSVLLDAGGSDAELSRIDCFLRRWLFALFCTAEVVREPPTRPQ